MLLYFCQNIRRCSNLQMSQMHILKYWFLFFFLQNRLMILQLFQCIVIVKLESCKVSHDMCIYPANHCPPEILSYVLEYLYSVGILSISIRHPGLYFFKLDTYSAKETFSQHYLLPSPAYFLYIGISRRT